MSRRPRLALPYTILVEGEGEGDTVRLVAGEDFRYTLTAPDLASWLPAFLRQCDGRRSLDELLQTVPEAHREPCRQLASRLYGERVLIDGTAQDSHQARDVRVVVEGTGPLVEMFGAALGSTPAADAGLIIHCQDRLDYEAALACNRRCRRERVSFLWATTGPLTRGYVSPVFLPDAGPCLECLVRHFQGLSPAPEFYEALRAQVQQGGAIEPTSFPDAALAMLRHLVLGKIDWLRRTDPPPPLYRLHVLEAATLEVTAHRVFRDPKCRECGERAG